MLTAVILIARDRSGRLILSLLVSNIGLGMVTLALPLYLHAHGTPIAQIGWVMALPGVGMLPFEFLWGWLADHVPVVVLLVISRLAFGVIVLGFALTTTVESLGVLYLLGTGFLVAAAPVGRGYLNAAVGKEHRGLAQSMHQAQWSFGNSIGAVVAGLMISKVGFAPTFIAAAVFPVMGAAMNVYTFRDRLTLTLSKVTEPATMASESMPYRWGLMLLTSLVVMCLLIGVSGMNAFLPLLITGQLHQTAATAGLAVSFLGLVTVVALLLMGQVSDSVGPPVAMITGLALTAVGIAGVGIASDIRILILALAFAGIGTALAWPAGTASLAQSAARARQGLIMGLYGGFENVGNIAGPLIAGSIWASKGGPTASFLALAFAALLGSGIGIAAKRSWDSGPIGRSFKPSA